MKELNTLLAVILSMPLATYASSDVHKSEVSVGIGAKYAPQYMGSNKYKSTVVPYFEWTDGTWFLSSEKGAGFTYFFDNGFYLEQALGYTWGRKDDDGYWLQDGSRHLKGMGKIKTALNSTTTLGWWMTPGIGFESNIIAPLTESQGVLYNIGLNVVLFNDVSDTLTVSIIRNYGDSRYNNIWFGVNENQSANTGFKHFNSDSGLTSVDYGIKWQHTFDDNWSGYADLRYTTLANRVSKSPIVKKDDYLAFTIGAFYTF